MSFVLRKLFTAREGVGNFVFREEGSFRNRNFVARGWGSFRVLLEGGVYSSEKRLFSLGVGGVPLPRILGVVLLSVTAAVDPKVRSCGVSGQNGGPFRIFAQF